MPSRLSSCRNGVFTHSGEHMREMKGFNELRQQRRMSWIVGRGGRGLMLAVSSQARRLAAPTQQRGTGA
jgi:hypothetical protein